VSGCRCKTLHTGDERDRIANVLIVEDGSEVTHFLLEILARRGIRGNPVCDKQGAIRCLEKGVYDLVFMRDRLSGGQDGFVLLERIQSEHPDLPVIMFADARRAGVEGGSAIVERGVRAIQKGCRDFLVEPLKREKVERLVETYLPSYRVSTVISADDPDAPGESLYRIVGCSPKLCRTVELARRAAPTSVPVLIGGESGTGKELFSYLVHHQSRRARGPYVRVNCAALNDSLLESELFGHEKGAFTGAFSQRQGRFERAHGGTLLLDEISESAMSFQAKLLRVLEQQDFERVGGNESVRVDVRIISTTNRDLLEEVRAGRFRLDLYYRLSAIRLYIAPLRERLEDIEDLVRHFVNLYARQASRRITRLDPAMMDIFGRYEWPGNIRQLRNVVLTSLVLGAGETLSLADVSWLFDELQPLAQQRSETSNVAAGVERRIEQRGMPAIGGMPLAQLERRAILDTLRQTAGNQKRAAEVLGISDRTLRGKIRRYREAGILQLT